MKRVLNLALAAVLGVAALVVPQTALASVSVKVPAGSVINPDGQIVKTTTLPASLAKKPGRDKGVYKGMPQPGGMTALVSCDGVGTSACFLYNKASQGSIVNKAGVIAVTRVGGGTGTLDTVHDYHTLSEIAVESADQKQIVEFGWTIDPVVNKTGGVGVTTPRPFVFYWINGAAGVYNGGGYVSVASPAVTPGVTDLTPGATPQMGIYHDDNLHAWWFQWGSSWIGYYPDTMWTGASPTATFTRMDFVQLFGEIASSVSKPCSDMGTGYATSDVFNTGKFGSTTFFNPGLTNDSASVNLSLGNIPSTTAGPPYAGVISSVSPPPATNLRSVYFGGPMWNAAKTGVGTRGAC